ncbi:hypothetical protein BHE18_14245 [Rossellomorea aquimaris]|uniref:Uncharacterized protein n=1 Tax=Rossellomorea aquimaris TaxID=189382 RepID=A0A1J6W6E6_9BACI|nr:hypothetical protein BHE18_14245 [Rossellomorea aquimaris]
MRRVQLGGLRGTCHKPLNKAFLISNPQERSDEEAHGSPAESEVFHGNQLRNEKPAKEKHILQKILSIYPLLIFILLA